MARSYGIFSATPILKTTPTAKHSQSHYKSHNQQLQLVVLQSVPQVVPSPTTPTQLTSWLLTPVGCGKDVGEMATPLRDNSGTCHNRKLNIKE